MKTLQSTILALFIGIAGTLSAQTMLKPMDATVMDDDMTFTGVSVMLNATPERVRDALEDWAEDEYDIDFDYKGGILNRDKTMLVADEVMLDMISNKQVMLRAKIVESGDGTKMTVFSSYGPDMAIAPNGNYNSEYRGTRMFVDYFLEDFVPAYYRERVENVNASIEELEEDIEGFREDMADNEERIMELQAENRELTQNIAEAEKNLKLKRSQLGTRKAEMKDAVDKVKGDR